jgi:chorismate-pyruvate lyase
MLTSRRRRHFADAHFSGLGLRGSAVGRLRLYEERLRILALDNNIQTTHAALEGCQEVSHDGGRVELRRLLPERGDHSSADSVAALQRYFPRNRQTWLSICRASARFRDDRECGRRQPHERPLGELMKGSRLVDGRPHEDALVDEEVADRDAPAIRETQRFGSALSQQLGHPRGRYCDGDVE